MATLPIKKIKFDEVASEGATWLRSKYAGWILAAISFAESVFAPILIDPFLIALIFANRKKWIQFILISIGASVLGGFAGYALGLFLFDTVGLWLLGIFGLVEEFNHMASNFDSNGFVFVLIGAFTPIPYKLVAIASGVLHIDLLTFVVASVFGRFFRLGLVGFAAYMVGPKALPMIQRHLHLFAAVIGIVLIAYILFKIVV